MSENQLYSSALKSAMALCAGREMCLHDVRQKLISRGIPAGETEKILNLLTEGKFIDEERYAMAYSKDKFKYNKWGKLKIAAGLRIKKIPDEIIARAMTSINETEYTDLLKSIIIRQQKSVHAKNKYDLKGKILRHCLSKGFESHLIYDLLNETE
jgi:regulatory protein